MKKWKQEYEEINLMLRVNEEEPEDSENDDEVDPEEEDNEIFKRKVDPLNLSLFTIRFQYGQGLNYRNYYSTMNFEINKDELLRAIHGDKHKKQIEPVIK